MKLKIKYIVFVLFFLCFSCDDFLDHEVTDSISDENISEIVAEDPSLVATFLKAAYRDDLNHLRLYKRNLYHAIPELAHEVDLDYTATAAWNEFAQNAVTSLNAFINYYYQWYYTTISAANLTIDLSEQVLEDDELSLSSDVISEIKNYKGEALFLRAFCHFMLLNMFGEKGPKVGGVYPNNKDAKGIILVDKFAEADNVYVARSTVGECYESIVNDLTEAKDFIGDNQIPANTTVRTPGSVDNDYIEDYGWAQLPAVYALLGKVYLYMNEYESAKTEFETVINDSRFALDKPVNFTDYIQHTDNNVESIFAMQYYTGTTGDITQQIPRIHTNIPNAWDNTFIDTHTFARFGSDPRIYEATLFDYTWSEWATSSSGPVWTTVDTAASDFMCYPRKYVDFYDYESPQLTTKNIEIIRLGDVYLMYAEAVLELGDATTALKYVNKLRRRAWDEDDYDSPGTQGEDLTEIDLSVIQDERFKELFFENSRWFDICRWQILEEELALYSTSGAGVITYNDCDYYFPIPESQIESNNLLEQSVGY